MNHVFIKIELMPRFKEPICLSEEDKAVSLRAQRHDRRRGLLSTEQQFRRLSRHSRLDPTSSSSTTTQTMPGVGLQDLQATFGAS